MTHYTEDLRTVVAQAVERLRDLPDSVVSMRPSPDAWSIKEVIGHLVDSAANNHHRFVRARSQANLVFSGYAQEDWVVAQDYNTAPWPELLDFWKAYNFHIARVMKLVPESVRFKAHEEHNLDVVAFHPPADGQSATLEHLMADYVAHLKHHLRQVEEIMKSVS